MGVVGAEGQFFDDLQPCGLGLRDESAARRQHAAREDVALDEVGAAPVVVEQIVGDGDGLDAGARAGFELTCHGAEKAGPVSLAHGLEHFDGGDAVVAVWRGDAVEVAVVAQFEPGLRRGLGEPGAGVGQLLGGQGDAVEAQPALRADFGQAAPAAADFQHPRARLELQLVEHAGVFSGLRLFQRQRGVAVEQGAGVSHARVEPELIEGVADVVMRVDVVAASSAAVAAQKMADAVGQPAQQAAMQRAGDDLAVGHQQLEQRGQIGRVPGAAHPGFGKGDVAALEYFAHDRPVVQRDFGMRAVVVLAEVPPDAIRAVKIEAADLQAFQQAQHAARGQRGFARLAGLACGEGRVERER